MPQDFSSHRDYMAKVEDAANARAQRIEGEIRSAFSGLIQKREVEVIDLSGLDAAQLGLVLENCPAIVKAVLSACNVAARAIARDLGINNFDTYNPRFLPGQAAAIAAYIKPFLPANLPLPVLTYLDRVAFIDKEIRRGKGGWEKAICEAANRHGSPRRFKKVKFTCDGNDFELDVASLASDMTIDVGIDVKRCEATRDKHKRIDEIVNKAAKFKNLNPKGKFGSVVYYPFADDQADFRGRARTPDIDAVVFANDDEDVVDREVRALLEMMGVAAPVPPSGGPVR